MEREREESRVGETKKLREHRTTHSTHSTNSGNGFGKISHDSSHVPETLEAGPQTKMGHFLQDRKEMIYETKRREPLGKSYVRGQMLPERVTKKAFAFGKGSSKSAFDAKELIYPKTVAGQVRLVWGSPSSIPSSLLLSVLSYLAPSTPPPRSPLTTSSPTQEEKHHDQYVRSHGAYLPGERKNREYEWEKWGIQPEEHSFGYTPISNNENVSECLKETRDLHLVSKVVSDHRGFAKDRLGRAKNLGQESDGLREGRPAGWSKKKGEGEPSAAECIAGMYNDEDCLPDKDLGRSLRPGWRNITDEPERAFGCPTIRKDLKAPKQRSFGDGKNYGDASESAHLLLHPSQFASLGIDDTEFTEARSPHELKE